MPDGPKTSRAPSIDVCGERAEGRESSVAGFVLAGGQSLRMGRDKALLPFAGEPLVARALGILRLAGMVASIAGAQSSLESFARVIADSEPGLGPLSGICAALHSTSTHWAVFLPVDLPLLPASLVAYLVRHAQLTGRAITVPAVSGFAQTFPAVIDRAALPALEAELTAGRRGCFSAFQAAAAARGQSVDAVAVELLVQSGRITHPHSLPALRWFLNLNSPGERDRAEALAGKGIPNTPRNARARGTDC